MPRRDADELSAGEWAVLALCAERPSHGFALAAELAPDGEVGVVWAVPRPLVYRALERLEGVGLVEERGTEESPHGPPRRVVGASAAGRARLRAWLQEPVDHVRDARYLLLLKLLFLDRHGGDAAPLVRAQTRTYGEIERRLERRLPAAEGFERVLLTWRLESARAATRFLERLGPAR
jgi:PadR family transcriptional regulator AphA